MPQAISPQVRQKSSTGSVADTNKLTAHPLPRVVKRSSSPELGSFKKTIAARRRESQLSTLDDIAQLSSLEKVSDKKGPGPAVVRKEVRLVVQAWAKRNGEPLSPAQLLEHALQAVSESTSSGRTSAWSEAERTALHALRHASPAVQRGQLAAMYLLEESGLMHATPDAAADALRCMRRRGVPRADTSRKLHRALKGRIKARIDEYEKQLKILQARFVLKGEEGLLKPALGSGPDSQRRLQNMRDKGQLVNVINQLRRLPGESGTASDVERFGATLEELDALEAAMRQCRLDAAEEVKAMQQYLMAELGKKLPSKVIEKLANIQAEPDSTQHDKAVARLLRKPITRPQELVDKLKTDAQLVEALQIIWGGPPVYCLDFARTSSELLSLSKQPALLLQQLEEKLLAHLGPEKLAGYAMQQVRVARLAKQQPKGTETGRHRIELIAETVDRVHTPPREKTATKAKMARKGYAVTPDKRPYQGMLDFLEKKRELALRQETEDLRKARADQANYEVAGKRKLLNRRQRTG